MILTGTKTAVGIGLTASFLATGGTAPYVYSVRPGGAGGTIDDESGLYTAPSLLSDDPKKLFDTIVAEDDNGTKATAQILVGDALLLFCEILQRELGLEQGRVFLWDQKIFQPTDQGLYIAVSVATGHPFANNIQAGTDGWNNSVQTLNMMATLDLDIISRGVGALRRKEEVIMALDSIYSQSQQEGNSFYIGKLPPTAKFVNLSVIDGAAIPYRFRISVNIQYSVSKTKPVEYFGTFEDVEVITDP